MPIQESLFDLKDLNITKNNFIPDPSQEEIEKPRPILYGDPFDFTTSPVLPKPAHQIEMVDIKGELNLTDRKIYNVILAASWEQLADPEFIGPFSAPASAIRTAVGQENVRRNDRIRESLDRLLDVTVSFPRLMADGKIGEAKTHLLSYRALPKDSGLVEWNFDPVLRPHLRTSSVWARLNLEVAAKFQSKYEILLIDDCSDEFFKNKNATMEGLFKKS